MRTKTSQTVHEKKILKILTGHSGLTRNKITSLAKLSRKRCAETLGDMVKDKFLNLQNERYEITPQGVAYLEEMTKRDKRGRQSRSQLTGRSYRT
jgi:predicted transcriptional regulator